MDWRDKAKKEYIAGGVSYQQLASKYHVSKMAVARASKEGGWIELRNRARAAADTKIVESVAEASRRRAERVQTIADKLLDRVERSIAELDQMTVREAVRVRDLEYNDRDNPGKLSREIVHETESAKHVTGLIDRRGLRELTAALKDLKEVQMLRSELDRREQEARIAALEDKSKPAEDGGIVVRFEGGMEEYSG